MIVIGMPPGDRCLGILVGNSTGGTSFTGFPSAKVAIRLDLPVPSSPMRTVRSPVRAREESVAIDTARS